MAVQISGNDITVPRDGSFTRNVTIGGTLTYEDVTNIDSVGLVTARNGIEIGARPGVAASISVDGNMIVSGITTFTPGGSEIVRINSGGLLAYNDVSFFGDSTNAYWDKSANQFLLNDNTKISLGSSSDLQLYHDGSNSYVNNSGTGVLILQGNGSSDISVRAVSGESGVVVKPNGGASLVELYYNNSKRLETDANGIHVTTNVHLPDNGVLELGNDSDLQIYYNSSSNTNEFASDLSTNFRGKNLYFYTNHNNSSESAIMAYANAAVELYYDNTKQCETSANGLAFPSGKGISFAATGDASGQTSELLDDYEEGTWSPVWSDASSGGTTSVSAQMHGRYTKIGRMVTLHFYTWGLPTGPSGSIHLQGLPYTAAQIGETFGAVQAGYFNDGNTSTYNLGVSITTGNNYGLLQFNNPGNNDVTAASFSGFINNYTNFTGTVTYLAA